MLPPQFLPQTKKGGESDLTIRLCTRYREGMFDRRSSWTCI